MELFACFRVKVATKVELKGQRVYAYPAISKKYP